MDDFKPKSFSELKGIYSDKYIQLLEQISIQYKLSFDDIYMKLPSPEIIQKDECFINDTPITRVLLGVADPASYVLTCFYLISVIPRDYPEQPMYYISKSEGSIEAPFTKSEFLESIELEKGSKLARKK